MFIKQFVNNLCKFLLIFIFSISFCGCIKSPEQVYKTIPFYDKLSVNFLDVSNGDCIFINLPDGKTALIDCGSKNSTNYKKITQALGVYSVKTIDYFILTHPHENHVGNALDILKNYKVNQLFIPYLNDNTLFPQFSQAVDYAKNNGVNVIISTMKTALESSDYNFVFLYPDDFYVSDSAYDKLFKIPQPSALDVDNISAVLYLEYMGIRFLFTGDIPKTAEQTILDYYSIGYYSSLNVNLENIDFLKVSSHGENQANSQNFLQLLKSKNAFVSVNKNNPKISDEVLSLLSLANQDCRVLRSDYHGWLSVNVKEQNSFTYSTLKYQR